MTLARRVGIGISCLEETSRQLPKHINLTIEHQPQATNYETVEEWLDGSRDYCDTQPEDREKMIATGEVWLLHWYPNTPVGFNAVAAASLDRCLEIANAAV